MAKRVYVGMSGGVDSSVAAALLKEQGYDVTGVYMKNWSQDLPGFVCPWKEDYQDAKRAAVHLGIPFKLYDFENEYQRKVVDYMIAGYKAGLTPNPDIMCNQEVKFKLFLETALQDGADLIATGHYARISQGVGVLSAPSLHPQTRGGELGAGAAPGAATSSPRQTGSPPTLLAGVDKNKDQSYFLYRVTQEALERSLMPLGELNKPEVRQLAKKLGLSVAEKKDSQGICFVGKVGIKEFLQQFVKTEPGAIIDQHGKTIGEHDGALFYTIGQRQGLGVGGGLPYYVVGKNMAKNEIYVTADLQDERLWSNTFELALAHWINAEPDPTAQYHVRTRYRAELIPLKGIQRQNGRWRLELKDEVRALTPGQSAVLYEADRVVGGGIVV